MLDYLFCIMIGIILGCISPSYFLAKQKGFDIRKKGSGNAGASNAFLTMGIKYAVLVGAIDIFKSTAAVLIAKALFPDFPYAGIIAGCAAILGHMFPFYLGFRGGKGFACYLGMILGLDWKLALIVIALVVVIILTTNRTVWATFFTMAFYPVYLIVTKAPLISILAASLVSLIMLVKHHDNISRLINGTEPVFLKKKNKASE